MTNKEAIKVFRGFKFLPREQRAVDMAIRALEQEPEDCISRQAVLAIAGDSCFDLDNYEDIKEFCDEIKDLPSVTPQPKTGHWININEGKWNTIPAYKCSVCGENANLQDWSGESPFCPWCGAKMQESEG